MMNNEKKQSFLGTGWAFPPAFNKNMKAVEMVSDRMDIEQSMEILLGTRPGERVMRPDYGCNLDRLVFEPLDTSLKSYMSDVIKTAILYHEPRINVEKVDIEETRANDGLVRIHIEYIIRTTNSRYNYVYPLKKESN